MRLRLSSVFSSGSGSVFELGVGRERELLVACGLLLQVLVRRDGQAADETEALEISEGEEGQTDDPEKTDAGYIKAAADGEENA